MEALAEITHRSCAIGWGLVTAGAGLVIGGHQLGVEYNDARGNHFERHFHRTALVISGVALLFGLVAIGVDGLAAAIHRRDARRGIVSLD